MTERKRKRATSAAAANAARAPVAVIDIGSNSLRLVVYDHLGRAPLAQLNEKSLCGLGRGLDRSGGNLGEAAVACALHAVRRFVRIAEGMGAGDSIDIFATEAVRAAGNGEAFREEVERVAGRPVHLLSGEDEARFSALGVAASHSRPTGIVVDMGGGSLEFARLDAGAIAERFASLPLGSLPMTALLERASKDKEAAAAVDEALAAEPWLEGAAEDGALFLVGGSWRALARIRLATESTPLRVVHGYTLAADEAADLAKQLTGTKRDKVAAIPGVPRRRADGVAPAALLLDRLLRHLRPRSVVFSVLGLREGRLFARLPEGALDEDPLLAGAKDLARAAGRVPAMGEALIRWTEGLFPAEPDELRRLRHAICELSDTGWREVATSRAREQFFLLAQYPFIGVDHAELVHIAFAIFLRHGGKPDDGAVQPMLALLPEPRRRRAEILGHALDLAYRLSGGVPGLLETTRVELAGRELRLHVGADDPVPDSDALQPRLDRLAAALELARSRIIVGG